MKKSLLIILLFFLFVNICLYVVYAFPPSSSELYNGIDVSEWQGEINFNEVAGNGIKIVYIRASEGNSYVDPYFKQNYINAKNAGLKVGFYHFLTATNTYEAEEQARFFVSVIRGTNPDCRLAIDFEVFNGVGTDEINLIAEAFLSKVEELSGKEMVIYSDAYNAETVFSGSLAEKYPIWVADYFVEEPMNNGKWDSWVGFQYSDEGRVSGIYGNVDKDYFTDGIFLNSEEPIKVPETQEPDPNTGIYIVEEGNTLSDIAMEFNTSYQYLAKINNIANPNLIFVGQKIKVPNYDTNEIHDTNHKIYIVEPGDTLTAISEEYGVSIQSIVNLNNIQNPNLIYVGETLRIPM